MPNINIHIPYPINIPYPIPNIHNIHIDHSSFSASNSFRLVLSMPIR